MPSLLNSEDVEKFKRLHIQNILQLALITPSSFEDRHLSETLDPNKQCVVDATIKQVLKTPKTLKIILFAHNFEKMFEAVIFHPKPYMIHQFKVNERGFYTAKAQYQEGQFILIHPVKISQIGLLVPYYKTPLRVDVMRRLIEKYIKVDYLVQEGLPLTIAKIAYDIHFPNNSTSLNGSQIEALKFIEWYDYLRRLQRKRRYSPTKYSGQGNITEWIETLPFLLTNDQKAALKDIKEDLFSSTAARRMIVGDVGSGKTMVILGSVILMRPYRSILMAPTTILANQLYEEASKFLPNLKVALITNLSLIHI